MKVKTLNTIKKVGCILLGALFIVAICILSITIQLFDISAKKAIGSFLWNLIYVALPIVAFVLPLALTLIFKHNLKKTILGFVISIIVYAIVAFGTFFAVNAYLSDFTYEKWERYQDERHLMIDDLASEVNFIGMAKDEVIGILGEPEPIFFDDADGADVVDYYVGADLIDPISLSFVFEDNKVIEVYKYTEVRGNKMPLY